MCTQYGDYKSKINQITNEKERSVWYLYNYFPYTYHTSFKMAISMNSKVIFSTKANFLNGIFGNKNGNILIGDKAFEFYNARNPEDYIQIPWDEIEKVRAQLFFKDRYIRGFFIDTKILKKYFTFFLFFDIVCLTY